MRARECIPARYFKLINISGYFPAFQNPKPVAERGANAVPGDAAERRENAGPRAPLGGR